MTRRNRLLLLPALTLALAAVLLVPECRWRIVGWVKGEAFYLGRPTSYWAECMRAEHVPPYWTRVLARLGHRESLHELRSYVASVTYINACWPGLESRFFVFSGHPEAVPVLLQLLKDEDVDLRRNSAGALLEIGPGARSAVLDLTAAFLHDEDPVVRENAARALASIDPEAAAAAGVKP